MNRWVVLTSVAGLAGAAWLFGGHEPPSPPPAGDRPWEVTLAPDGSSRALGLTLGRSTLGDAIARFGKGVDVAMFESAGRPLSLEAYFAEASSGGLSGRLVVTLAPEPTVLEGLRARGAGPRRLQSGSLRYELDPRDADTVAGLRVASLTFVPRANLDEDTVRARFGEPVERVPAGEGQVRWLYPERGVAVTLSEQGREMIDYFAPGDTARLRQLSTPAPAGD